MCYTDLVSAEEGFRRLADFKKTQPNYKTMKNQIIASFDNYNERRFSSPWVCKMGADGTYNFDDRIGVYTGNSREGEGGDLVIFDPEIGQVYGYGQKDHRGNRTVKKYAKWDGEKFVACDILGREMVEA